MQPPVLMHMKLQSELPLPILTGGGRRGALGTRRTQQAGQSRSCYSKCSRVAAGPVQLPGVREHRVGKSVILLL